MTNPAVIATSRSGRLDCAMRCVAYPPGGANPAGGPPPAAPPPPPNPPRSAVDAPFAIAVTVVAVTAPVDPFVPWTITVSPGCIDDACDDAVRVTLEFDVSFTFTVDPESSST